MPVIPACRLVLLLLLLLLEAASPTSLLTLLSPSEDDPESLLSPPAFNDLGDPLLPCLSCPCPSSCKWLSCNSKSASSSLSDSNSGSSIGINGKHATNKIVDNPKRNALQVIGPNPCTITAL